MQKKISINLSQHFDDFIQKQIQTGKFSSASEVVRAALRLFENSESKKAELIKALKKGEEYGFVKAFNKDSFLKYLHQKYIQEKE